MAQSNSTKLGIKPDSKVTVQGIAVDDAARIIGVPMSLVANNSATAVSVLFAENIAVIRSGARAVVDGTIPGGRAWIAYRKGASRRAGSDETPLHRDTLQAALAEIDLDGVTLISLDDQWSAMRIKRV